MTTLLEFGLDTFGDVTTGPDGELLSAAPEKHPPDQSIFAVRAGSTGSERSTRTISTGSLRR
jgi:hypothetical protein